VIKLVAKGLTNPQIGERLFVSRATVKTHLAHIFTKLGVRTRAELAAETTLRGR
jgi:DNA-binding NarL/FixJ family response regulator